MEKPQKANVTKAQGFKAKGKKPQPYHAYMYHNKRHTHMHIRPQKFMHCCYCKLHVHTRPFISKKATNHLSHNSFSKVGKQNRFSKIKYFYCMKF